MPTIRLYRAIKEQIDANAIHKAAVFNGNYGPEKSLGHGSPIVLRLREANIELQEAMKEASYIVELGSQRERNNARRMAGEKDVVMHAIKMFAEEGFKLSFQDQEGMVQPYTQDVKKVHEAVFSVDMGWVSVRRHDCAGAFLVVLGNSPQECIADYTNNLEPWMKKVQEYVNSFYGEL